MLANLHFYVFGSIYFLTGFFKFILFIIINFSDRKLLNYFSYSAVAYIDCDTGQCEFTLSGCISFNLISEPLFGKIDKIKGI